CFGRGANAPAHPKPVRYLRERLSELSEADVQPRGIEPDAHEERFIRAIGVLLGIENVGPVPEKKARDCGDDPLPVGTNDRQDTGVRAFYCRRHPITRRDPRGPRGAMPPTADRQPTAGACPLRRSMSPSGLYRSSGDSDRG